MFQWSSFVRRNSSSLFSLSLMTFVVHYCPSIPTFFSHICFALPSLGLLSCALRARPFQLSVLALLKYLAINFLSDGWKIIFLPNPGKSFLFHLLFSRQAEIVGDRSVNKRLRFTRKPFAQLLEGLKCDCDIRRVNAARRWVLMNGRSSVHEGAVSIQNCFRENISSLHATSNWVQ